jgi:hypothetical protein
VSPIMHALASQPEAVTDGLILSQELLHQVRLNECTTATCTVPDLKGPGCCAQCSNLHRASLLVARALLSKSVALLLAGGGGMLAQH